MINDSSVNGSISGLPLEWDSSLIPEAEDMERAAYKATHEVKAALLQHADDPAWKAANIERLGTRIQAAVSVQGRHRPHAIRVGLHLHYKYWMRAGKLEVWHGLLLNMISAARDINDPLLMAEVYRAWGIYWYRIGRTETAIDWLEGAIDKADLSERDDILLLARMELFNSRAHQMPLEDAIAEADVFLEQARLLGYKYVAGRAYLTLGRVYEGAYKHRESFMYAQQALSIFAANNYHDLMGQAASIMLGAIQVHNDKSSAYRRKLLEYIKWLVSIDASPVLESIYNRHWSTYSYHNGQYEQARKFAIKAWLLAHAVKHQPTLTRNRHMLGLIYCGLQEWDRARHHLRVARRAYEKSNNLVMAYSAWHALAYLPYWQGYRTEAVAQLKTVLAEARRTISGTADDLIALIEEDIRMIEGELECEQEPQR